MPSFDSHVRSGHNWRKFKPMNDNILIRRKPAEEKSPGGLLFIPQNAQEKIAEGEVLAVGPGRSFADGSRSVPDVAVGDWVLFSKHAEEITLDGERFVLVGATNIHAVVSKE